ncbi:MASE1 domain-containing protein [Sodalinema gerasimenkoae]|uniref:MASE1 domain-containing protein n=1 Tax=Sodalinema gerasimenkoae TaxID=2862348 RepID=UPI00135AB823|nr:MASE1 domain-containing protein [Sodalinema gerasimenkoae]
MKSFLLTPPPIRNPHLLKWVIVALLYFTTAQLSLRFAALPGNISSVWFPTGLVLGVSLWRFRWHAVPGVFFGSMASTSFDLLSDSSPQAILPALFCGVIHGAGSALELAIALSLLRTWIPQGNILQRVPHVGLFILSLLPASLTGAIFGVFPLVLLGLVSITDSPRSLLIWWWSGVLSQLLIAPVFLAGMAAPKQWQPNPGPYRYLEVGLFFTITILILINTFGLGYPAEYALIPLCVWSVLRFGKFETTLFVFGISLIAIFTTVQGLGPFASHSNYIAFLLLQSFMGAAILTSLVLSASNDEHHQLERQLRTSNRELHSSQNRLSQLLEAMPVGVCVHDRQGQMLYRNQTAQQLLGDVMANLEQFAQRYHLHKADSQQVYPLQELPGQIALSGQSIRRDDLELHHPDGIIPLDMASTPLLDDHGRVDSVIVAFQDIRERKEAQKLLADYNQTLENQVVQRTAELQTTLSQLQRTQAQLVHTEKMSSLGQLVAGVAHEINNPISFIFGNIRYTKEYISDLLRLLNAYETAYPNPKSSVQELADSIDINYLIEDVQRILESMNSGAERIRNIVLSLRNFARLDEAETKIVNLHEGLDSTLMVLRSRLKLQSDRPAIQVIKAYGDIPKVHCYPSELNQVFLNVLNNAIDALASRDDRPLGTSLADPPTITITTQVNPDHNVSIKIQDNGVGMNPEVCNRIFDPFFSTKPVGSGTGLGLSMSYQIIVEKHRGKLSCESALGQGTTVTIQIPVRRETGISRALEKSKTTNIRHFS